MERILNLQKATIIPNEFNVRDSSRIDQSARSSKTSISEGARENQTETPSSLQKSLKVQRDSLKNDFFGSFKSITKNLGLNGFSELASKHAKKETGKQSSEFSPIPKQPQIHPQDKQILAKQLQDSISSTSAANEKSIKTRFPTPSPTPAIIHENCTVLTDQDLVLLNTSKNIPVYIDKSVLAQGQAILQESPDAIERFSLVLRFLSVVFDLKEEATQIYWDSDGATVAFNRNKSLFFNLRYYLGWHYKFGDNEESLQTYFYWFMTFCHELAHNFHAPHDATHEYWMSSFAEQYMGNLIQALRQYKVLK